MDDDAAIMVHPFGGRKCDVQEMGDKEAQRTFFNRNERPGLTFRVGSQPNVL